MSLSSFIRRSLVQGYKGPPSDHFDGKVFVNLDPVETKSIWEVLKWRLTAAKRQWPSWVESTSGETPAKRLSVGECRYTFINHASFLIQLGELNILTDPIWSERCSPLDTMGPRRVRAPGLRFDQLPPIDVVLLSHNHYDHMDLATLEQLERDHHPLFVVGLGNADFLKGFGLSQLVELDWYQNTPIKNSTLHFVPARHFSRRGWGDAMKTLWGGFMIQGEGLTIYFAGDTGYGRHFSDIRDRFPEIDLALIPIGAYEPRWFMQPVHLNPAEAVQAHLDLHARQSVGMHFGTFPLADDSFDAPPKALAAAREKANVAPQDFIVPEFGKSYSFR